MKEESLNYINKLIENNKIKEAQIELSKLGSSFFKNSDYLYLRSKIFYINKLYYLAIDTLLISSEFEENDKVYDLISEIYGVLGNNELSKKIANPSLRNKTLVKLKKELTGISQDEES